MQRRLIVIPGAPASVNAPAARKVAWVNMVKRHARSIYKKPWRYRDLRIKIQFFRSHSRMRDADNISKPICDALQGVVYNNDNQIVQRQAEIKRIDGAYRIVGVNLRILRELKKGDDFVAVTIDRIGEGITRI